MKLLCQKYEDFMNSETLNNYTLFRVISLQFIFIDKHLEIEKHFKLKRMRLVVTIATCYIQFKNRAKSWSGYLYLIIKSRLISSWACMLQKSTYMFFNFLFIFYLSRNNPIISDKCYDSGVCSQYKNYNNNNKILYYRNNIEIL